MLGFTPAQIRDMIDLGREEILSEREAAGIYRRGEILSLRDEMLLTQEALDRGSGGRLVILYTQSSDGVRVRVTTR